jgi:hypothetical protein
MESDMRLTQAQKRDLLRMSGAAVVSTIFFGVPMFVGRPDASRVQVPPALVQLSPAPAVTPDIGVERRDTDVAVVFSEAVAQVSTPKLGGARTPLVRPARQPRASRRNPPALAAAAEPGASQGGTPLARRLGRLLAGSGRYQVRPFPTVGTSGS